MKRLRSLGWLLLAVGGLRARAGEPGASSPAPSAGRVDAIVAIAGARIVTRSDVALEQELFERFDASLVPPWSRRELHAEARLVQAALLRERAGDGSVYRPSLEEVRARVAKIRAGAPSPEAWAACLERWGLDEPTVEGLVFSRMVVERYVVRSLAARSVAAGTPLTPGEPGWDAGFDTWMRELGAEGQPSRVQP